MRKEEKLKAKEKRKHTHLNSEFQRIARREKKAFLRDQCKEKRKTIEWERLAISSKKIRDYQENISCKEGHNKGQK